MSIEVMRYVWKYSKAKANGRLMLLAIADIANDNGDAYPGVDKLSTKCNMSHRSAQLVINDLERMKELRVYENVGTKTISGWTNLYRVTLEGVQQGDVRKPNGEVATARTPNTKKQRTFIEGVQPVTPLKDMQPVTPDDMQPDSPHGVQPVTPNPPEYPPEDTTVKRATSQSPQSGNSDTVKGNPPVLTKKRSEKSPTTVSGWLSRLPAVRAVVVEMLNVCYEGWDATMMTPENCLTVHQLENYIFNSEEYVR